MSTKKHSKHAKIKRPTLGYYARTELSIIGTNCCNIQALVRAISPKLSGRISYVDMDHKAFDNDERPSYLQSGVHTFLSDKINYYEENSLGLLNEFDQKIKLRESDLVIVNGNHKQASKQIVVLDSLKTKSLVKRIDQITDVLAFIDLDGKKEICEEVKNQVPEWKDIPIIEYENREAITRIIESYVKSNTPRIKGLVLAGGKSLRMGEDKGTLNWWGKEQREYLGDLLNDSCDEVFISCRRKQLDDIRSRYELLADKYLGLGPYGAILSAFQHDPDAAWFVIACDLPLIDHDAIQTLVDGRDSSKFASAYFNDSTQFPDPLCTIWEPRAYNRLMNFLALGYSCPRKVLINSDIHIIQPSNSDFLLNANTPEDRAYIEQKQSKINV